MELPTSKKAETDFILWYRRKDIFGMGQQFLRSIRPIFGTAHPTETVFGEAKSFGKDVFEQDDVNKMELLTETFPGSILVFATMKEKLSQEEIDRIKSLAYWGRGKVSYSDASIEANQSIAACSSCSIAISTARLACSKRCFA